MRPADVVGRFGPWLIVVGSGSALTGLILTRMPSPLMQLVFLGFLFVGCFGLVLLLLRAYYGRRLSAETQRRDPQRPAREGLMLAGFVTLCAWLQTLRVLTVINALLLLGVLAVVEAFWVSRLE